MKWDKLWEKAKQETKGLQPVPKKYYELIFDMVIDKYMYAREGEHDLSIFEDWLVSEIIGV